MPFEDVAILVEMCHLGACNQSSPPFFLSIPVCQVKENRTEGIKRAFLMVEEALAGKELKEAAQLLYRIGEATENCDQVMVLFEIYILIFFFFFNFFFFFFFFLYITKNKYLRNCISRVKFFFGSLFNLMEGLKEIYLIQQSSWRSCNNYYYYFDFF